MEFNNVPNPSHIIDGRVVWESRSVAVTGAIFIYNGLIPYVLVSRRGPMSADFQGKMNLVAGYLDWNETGLDALIRETWEETGFNLREYVNKGKLLCNSLAQPWSVVTNPEENHQNVTLRYGACFQINSDEEFPILTTEHNEVVGECEDPMWLSIYDIDNYEWAFHHDMVIEQYYHYINERTKTL